MAKQFNLDTVVKKLKAVSNTQDSIPMLSLWIIHHKSHHKLIVDTWLGMMKKSKNSHKLTLLYLCNDVIQNCRRKNAPIYKESFSDVLPEAVTLLRDSSIKSNVQRVVKIWAKRGIFDAEYTDQLLAALITNRAPEKLRNKLLIEYKTSSLIEEIKQFKVLEDEIENDQNHLKKIRVDVSSSDAIRKLKDKTGGEKFSKEFEESATQLEAFLDRYEKYIERRKNLLELLDQGTVYYQAQYHEAKIVVNAYKDFEGRVNKMKRGLTKVVLSMTQKSGADVVPQQDNRGDDMEMSDEDKELGNKPSKIVAVDTSALRSHSKSSFNDKSSANAEIPRVTEDVIKLLANELQSIKNSEESAADSLKRVVTGLINRPGLRGASSTAGNTDTTSKDRAKGPLRFAKSMKDDTILKDNRREQTVESMAPAAASPPSPTGSPELNISSPPRHQSLESRIADIFNDDDVPSVGADKPQATDEVDSDSDSDTGKLIKRATDSLNEKMVDTKFLPGLGNLDEMKAGGAKIETGNELKPTEPQDSSLSTNILSSTVNLSQGQFIDTSVAYQTTSASSLSINQSIPVIGGLTRVAAPLLDGSSTPTLDEDPYTSTNVQYSVSSQSGIMSPPRFSGDALTFLTKFMGQATKTELGAVETASASVPSVPSQTASSLLYNSWPLPPTADDLNSKLPAAWNTQNTLPPAWSLDQPAADAWDPLKSASSLIPPPPVFSWPPSSVPSPPPWQQSHSSSAPASSAQPWKTGSDASQIPNFPPMLSTALKRDLTSQPENVSPVKKSKWDEDIDYNRNNRRASLSSDHNVNSGLFSDLASHKVTNRRNSNLITLSNEEDTFNLSTSEPASKEGASQIYEPMALLKSNMHGKPHDKHEITHEAFVTGRSSMPNNSGMVSRPGLPEHRHAKIYDRQGNQVASQAEGFHDGVVSPRLPLGIGGPFSQRSGPPRPRLPPPRFRAPLGASKPQDDRLQYELDLLEEERRRDAAIVREVAFREEMLLPRGPPPRGWSSGRMSRPPLLRPRLHRPPRPMGPLRPPRMHY